MAVPRRCERWLKTIAPEADDELIFLGDYVDRGPDSKGVIEQLIELQDRVSCDRACGVIMRSCLWSVAYSGTDAGGLVGERWPSDGNELRRLAGKDSRSPHQEFHSGVVAPLRDSQEAIFVHACYDPDV